MFKSVEELLKNVDAYPKTLEDFRIKTFLGGTITIISTILIVVLFLSESYNFFSPSITQELYVDNTRDNFIEIHFDITLHRIACKLISLDASDVFGEQHINIEHDIFKRRLDLNGGIILDTTPETVSVETLDVGKVHGESINESSSLSNNVTEKCLSCYGAERAVESGCCNTCQELVDAYNKLSWKLDVSSVEQCKGQNSESVLKTSDEGCQIYGKMQVNRVGGNFHIVSGKSISVHNMHIHDISETVNQKMNYTHTINKLSFKAPVAAPKLKINLGSFTQNNDEIVESKSTLDATFTQVSEGDTHQMFQYYLKIIPTLHSTSVSHDKHHEKLAYQYSVTRHTRSMPGSSGMGHGGPAGGGGGLFFSYEFAPFMIKYVRDESGGGGGGYWAAYGHFLTSLCAIVGGVFSIAGLCDKLVYNYSKYYKNEIGKHS